jgi:hypothetical protein
VRAFRDGLLFFARRSSWLPVFVSLVGLLAFAGCGNDSSTQPVTGAPEIAGASVPETAEEGSPLAIEVWGKPADPRWVLDHFDVRGDGSNVVTITPVGHLDPGGMAGETFRGTAELTAPAAGSHTVRVCGARGRMEFPLHVFPRHPILRLLVRGGPDDLHEELAVGAEGWAMAFRRGAPPLRVQLPAEQVVAIRQSFEDAGFFDLEDRYLGDEPSGDIFYHIFYRDADASKQIRAEDRLAPEPLRALVADLREMIDQVLQDAPPAHGSAGRIDVDPLVGEAGTPRSIRLTIENFGAEPETLRFDTAQTYDVAILGPMSVHGGDGMEDHGGSGGGPGNAMGGNLPVDPDSLGPPRLIWNWAFGQSFDQSSTEIVLGAGERIIHEIVWPGMDNDGSVPADGRYRVEGIVPAARRVPVRAAETALGNPPPPALRLVLRLAVEPREAAAGTSREMRFSIFNPTHNPITLTFPTSQTYDFHVFEHRMMHSVPLWTWSTGKAFERVETYVTIPPNDRIEIVESWDGKGDDGVLAGPGAYRVQARLALPAGPDLPMAEGVRIVVQP